MFFNHSNKTANKIEIKIENVVIPQVDNTKFLGIKIDQKLNWKNHDDLLLCKLKSNTKILQTNKKFVSKHVLKLLFIAKFIVILSIASEFGEITSHKVCCINCNKLRINVLVLSYTRSMSLLVTTNIWDYYVSMR